MINIQFNALQWGQVSQSINAQSPAKSGVNSVGRRSGTTAGNVGKGSTRRVTGGGKRRGVKGRGRNG